MYEDKFLIKQRDDSLLWKKLYDFPLESISQEFGRFYSRGKTLCIINLRTKILEISISKVILKDEKVLKKTTLSKHQLQITDYEKILIKVFSETFRKLFEENV